MRSVSARLLRTGDENRTLPLWMYVETPSKPPASKQALSAGILIRFFPPTLIPRSSATCVVITPAVYQWRGTARLLDYDVARWLHQRRPPQLRLHDAHRRGPRLPERRGAADRHAPLRSTALRGHARMGDVRPRTRRGRARPRLRTDLGRHGQGRVLADA